MLVEVVATPLDDGGWGSRSSGGGGGGVRLDKKANKGDRQWADSG